jgi:deoxyribose-phosphate aldolase
MAGALVELDVGPDVPVLSVTPVDAVGLESRAADLTSRSIKTTAKAALLDLSIRCIDLTTLEGTDTPGKVRALCAKARQPVRRDILAALGAADLPIRTASVCVYHGLVEAAAELFDHWRQGD